MQRVTEAMLQRFAKTQPVDGARTVLVDLGGGGLPASEAAFAEAFDDLAQPSNDGIAFIVTGAATFIQPCVEADTGCRGSGSIWPACDAQCSGLMKPDTHLGENARHIEVSDDQATSCLFR